MKKAYLSIIDDLKKVIEIERKELGEGTDGDYILGISVGREQLANEVILKMYERLAEMEE